MFAGSDAMLRPPVATGLDMDDGSSVGRSSAGRHAFSDGSQERPQKKQSAGKNDFKKAYY